MATTLNENIKNALYDGRTDIILAFLKTQTNDSEDQKIIHQDIDSDGTMLHIASKLGNQDLIRALLMCNANTSVPNGKGLTPIKINISSKVQQIYIDELFRRISKNDLEYVDKLIQGGLDIDTSIPSLDCNTCLHWAAIFSSPEIIKYLHKHGAQLDVTNDKALTPLHEAILANKVENIRQLIALGANCNLIPATGKFSGMSALQLAAGQDGEIGALLRNVSDKARSNLVHVTCPVANGNAHFSHMDLDQMTLDKSSSAPDGRYNEPELDVPSCGSGFVPKQLTEAEISGHTFLKVLWPRPRQIYLTGQEGEAFVLPPNVNVCLISHLPSVTCVRMWEVWEIFRESFSGLGSVLLMQPPSMRSESNIVCLVDDRMFPKEQGYKLVVSNKQIKLIARDVPGMYYGIATVREILRATPEFILPQFTIVDWPAYPTRGLVLDISTSKVPKIGALTRIIDSLAGLKMNKIYLRTVFGDGEWSAGDLVQDWQVSYSAMDVLFLERYCQECCLNLIPALDIGVAVSLDQLEALKRPIQRFLNSFTGYRELYVGPSLCRLLTGHSRGAADPSLGLELFFFPAGRSSRFSLLLDCSNVETVDYDKLVANLGPDSTLALPGTDGSSTLAEKLYNHGLTHVVVVDSVWGRSLAGNHRCDFPHTTPRGLRVSRGVRMYPDDFDMQGLVGNLGYTVPNLVDHVFAWPMIMSLASQGWSGSPGIEPVVGDGANEATTALASVLSWHIFPQDVECVLSKALLELGSIEYEMSRPDPTYGPVARSKDQPGKKATTAGTGGSFFYDILTAPEDVDLKPYSQELFNKALKNLKRIQNALVTFQKPNQGPSAFATKDERFTSYVVALELMTFGCRLGKCLIVAGTNPDPTSPTGQQAPINVGLANVNPIHKTDLANKLLDIIKLFKANWLEHNLDENLEPTVDVLEKLFRQLAPHADANV